IGLEHRLCGVWRIAIENNQEPLARNLYGGYELRWHPRRLDLDLVVSRCPVEMISFVARMNLTDRDLGTNDGCTVEKDAHIERVYGSVLVANIESHVTVGNLDRTVDPLEVRVF